MSAVPMLKSATTAGNGLAALTGVEKLLERIRPHWRALAPRERLGVLASALVLGCFVLWLAGISPALRTLRTVPAQRAELEAQLQVMKRQAAECETLRQQPPVPPGQAESALRTATEQLGSAARMSTTADRATVTLDGIDGSALIAWLTQVRTASRARVVESQLTRNDKGYSGTVVLGLQRP